MYTTAELIALLDDSRESSRFAIRNFFNQVILSEERQIAWDVVKQSRRISPFVMAKVDGKVMEKEGFYTKFIAPAYIKDKCAICPTDALIRRAGEDFSMPTSPQARLDALVVQGLRDAEQRVENRLEVMAMELIRTGTVTLTGEDYPTTVIDMGRAADLDVNVTTLSGPLGAGNATVWSDGANNNVLDNIEELSQRMSLKDEGAPATDLIRKAGLGGARPDFRQDRLAGVPPEPGR